MTPTVLVIDDVAATRTGLAELLRLKGFAVREAGSGREGLQRLREDPRVAVVILDLLMPQGDGYWFREQQLQDPALGRIPVIVFTGAADADTARARLHGADILHKPVDVGQLLATLARVIAHPGNCMRS